jgi:hypothetical protein
MHFLSLIRLFFSLHPTHYWIFPSCFRAFEMPVRPLSGGNYRINCYRFSAEHLTNPVFQRKWNWFFSSPPSCTQMVSFSCIKSLVFMSPLYAKKQRNGLFYFTFFSCCFFAIEKNTNWRKRKHLIFRVLFFLFTAQKKFLIEFSIMKKKSYLNSTSLTSIKCA